MTPTVPPADPPLPDDPTMAKVRRAVLGEVRAVPIVLEEPDPTWPQRYRRERDRLRAALGDVALGIEHVGSTSVPGLHAKPIIDVLLLVPDPADEPAYVPALEAAGYHLRVREPDFEQHRMLRPATEDAHVHVFAPGAVEVTRMLAFRDRLRTVPEERDLYLRTKRALAGRDWPTMQHYADAKSEVVEAIIARALADG